MPVIALFVLASLVGFSQEPKVKPTVGLKPPRHAVVLFDGKDSSHWYPRNAPNDPCKWEVKDGCLVVVPGTGDMVSKETFGDYRAHVEFWLPLLADKEGQERSNSGVYQHGRYEIQVLDSYKNPTYKFGGCGAIYGQKDPDVNAIIPPENWNTYDITFRAPRLDAAGNILEKPRITVFHNGLKIHDNAEIKETPTTAGIDGKVPPTGPLMLQDHGAAVRFRNVWVQPIKLK